MIADTRRTMVAAALVLVSRGAGAPAPPAEGVLRVFVVAGPEGVWELADRHLADGLAAALKEARAAHSLCRS